MKAIGYVRVSTDEQAESGVSLAAQEQKIRAYCDLYDLELVEICSDAGASGKTLDRPGLDRVLRSLTARNAEAVVVAKLDRLTRSVIDLGALLDEYFGEKFQLLSVSEQVDTRTAAGRLVLNILTTVAQWERETIGERTSIALQHKKRNGEYTGGRVPYGKRLEDGRLVDDIEEQAAVTVAKKLRTRGMSLRKIGTELLRRDIRPRTGNSFSAQQVKQLLAA